MELSERNLILTAIKEAKEMPHDQFKDVPGYPYIFEKGKYSAFGPYQIQYGLMEEVLNDANGLSEASGVDVPDGFEDYLSQLIQDSKNKRNFSLGYSIDGKKLDPEIYGPLKTGTISREDHEKFYPVLANLALQRKIMLIPEGQEINVENIAKSWHGNPNKKLSDAYGKAVNTMVEELSVAPTQEPMMEVAPEEEAPLATPPGQGGTTIPFVPNYLYGMPAEQYAELTPNEQESIKTFISNAKDEEADGVLKSAQRLAATRSLVKNNPGAIPEKAAQSHIEAARYMTAGMMYRKGLNNKAVTAVEDENTRKVFLTGMESEIKDPIIAEKRGKKANEGAMMIASNLKAIDTQTLFNFEQTQLNATKPMANNVPPVRRDIPSTEDFIKNISQIKPDIV